MKRVVVFGTFDIFHEGHRDYFRQAAKMGDYLFAVVARDETVKKVKGKYPLNSEKKRLLAVKNSGLVDRAVLGNLKDKYAVLKDIRPDVICLGYDQKVDLKELQKRILDFGLKNATIKKLKSYKPEIYKSSKLKNGKRNQ